MVPDELHAGDGRERHVDFVAGHDELLQRRSWRPIRSAVSAGHDGVFPWRHIRDREGAIRPGRRAQPATAEHCTGSSPASASCKRPKGSAERAHGRRTESTRASVVGNEHDGCRTSDHHAFDRCQRNDLDLKIDAGDFLSGGELDPRRVAGTGDAGKVGGRVPARFRWLLRAARIADDLANDLFDATGRRADEVITRGKTEDAILSPIV